jgi:hypothetical protein
MVLSARLRTTMSSIIRWRKAETLPAGGIEYAEGFLLLIASTGMEKAAERQVGDSRNQASVRLAGRANRTAQGGLVHFPISWLSYHAPYSGNAKFRNIEPGNFTYRMRRCSPA